LPRAAEHEHNVIVRPHGPGVAFIQLDDLNAEALARVRELAFLGLQTSAGNFQAWLAMPAAEAEENLARRLRKGAGADPTASGATRIAGSLNFKAKYAPNFPRVEIAHSAPGLMARKENLAHLGLLPEEPQTPARNAAHTRTRPGPRKWPSYQRCIEGAPPTHGNVGPDISRADFTWCMIAVDWGWSIADIVERLMMESPKARQNGPQYALRTAQRAAAARRR
ncbi:MAG: DNA-primase RepB domain-containing protein, partial [Terriglobales bacterium]